MSRCKSTKYVGGFLGVALAESDYIFTPHTRRRKYPYKFERSTLDHADPIAVTMALEDSGLLVPKERYFSPPYWIDATNYFRFGVPRFGGQRGELRINYEHNVLPDDDVVVRMYVEIPPRIYRNKQIEVILD